MCFIVTKKSDLSGFAGDEEKVEIRNFGNEIQIEYSVSKYGEEGMLVDKKVEKYSIHNNEDVNSDKIKNRWVRNVYSLFRMPSS